MVEPEENSSQYIDQLYFKIKQVDSAIFLKPYS